MSEPEISDLQVLKRDLALRGYDDSAVSDLLHTPILLIPGPLTPTSSNEPIQKLTNHIVYVSKDLQRQSIPNKVVIRTNAQRNYIEERHAHIDLGTIVVSIVTAQQLGVFANIAQILDFLLNLIEARFSRGRTEQLMPNVKFNLIIQNGEKMAKMSVEGSADALVKMTTPARLKAMLQNFDGGKNNEAETHENE